MSEPLAPGDMAVVIRDPMNAGMVVTVVEDVTAKIPLSPCVEGKAVWIVESEGGPFNGWAVAGRRAIMCGCCLRKIPPLSESTEDVAALYAPEPKAVA